MDAFDLSIILNNALANAVEAAKGGESAPAGYVRITSALRENVYIIEVENSFDHPIVRNRESDLPVSTKEDKVFHGFGLRNIRQVAQKYHGDMEVQVQGQVFRLSVMMQVCWPLAESGT